MPGPSSQSSKNETTTHLLSPLLEAFQSQSPASGLTHTFYKYPARFAPEFARAAILAFTKPGDVVLDPFMGGGTTLVESLATGRHCIGSDLNSLAKFIVDSKTSFLSQRQLKSLLNWASYILPKLTLNPSAPHQQLRYPNQAPMRVPWNLRFQIDRILQELSTLPGNTQRRLAKCALLRTAQWALDCTTSFPSVREFREKYILTLMEFSEGLLALQAQAESSLSNGPANVVTLDLAAESLNSAHWLGRIPKKPTLALTSPPYPQVHVLYNRWQIKGRKETSAPYWIIGHPDGAFSSKFTMGSRSASGLESYFQNLSASFRNIRSLLSRSATLVQIVAFSNPTSQLPRYLAVLDEAGFSPVAVTNSQASDSQIPTRAVPHRKWYASYQGNTDSSREYLLIHTVGNRA